MTADFLLPADWIPTRLDDVLLSIVGGGTPSKSNPSFYDGDIPWMSVKDMNKNILESTVDHISQKAVANSSTNIIPAGTPIIATRMSLGKIVIAKFDSAINQDLKALFPSTEINRDYLIYWYRSIAKDVRQLGTGTTVKGIRLEVLKELQFPLSSFAEQKIVAEKLGHLLQQIEIIKAHIERVPHILKRLRQSILTAAVNGELTEEWRRKNKCKINGNTLSSLLKQDHEMIGGHARGNASDPTEGVHDLTDTDIPKGWGISLLRDICAPGRPITYGILKPGPELEVGVPYIRVADFPGNKLNLNNIKKTSNEIDEQYKRARLKTGDLLLSIRGSVGRLIKIPKEMDGANITQDTARLSISDMIVTDYIYYALLSDSVQHRINNAIRGVAVRGINIGDVRALQIPMPSFDEQAEIARRVKQFFAHTDTIEQQVKNAQVRVNNLTQSILTKAFRGELTEQWRKENGDLIGGENSAIKLLEKITAEREALKGQPKTKKTNVKEKVDIFMNKEIKVLEALKAANKPLSGQQLFFAAGYSNDSSSEKLELFFLDVREALTDKTIIKTERSNDGQDWFALAKKH